MTASMRRLVYGSRSIEYSVARRPRQTLEITVQPDMRVEVVAPVDATLDDIEAKLRKRAKWVLKQQSYFSQFQPRTPERQYVSGETHLYLGRQYRLKVVRHVQKRVKLIRGFIVVHTHYPDRQDVTRDLVDDWYASRARVKFDERLQACLDLFPKPDELRPRELIVRRMKSRWGSMTQARRLVLNRDIIRAPVESIDYVITHELCHVPHPHHGRDFFTLLGAVMPDWEARKLKLERILV